MVKIVKIFVVVLSYLYFGLALVIASDDVELPFGTRVSRAGIQKIMDAKNVAQFIESIEDENLKVIAIDRKLGPRTGITIPESHWASIENNAIYQKYFDSIKKNRYSILTDVETHAVRNVILSGVHIPKGKTPWNQHSAVLLIYKDAPLSVLFHQYLLYLISKSASRLQSPVHTVIEKPKFCKPTTQMLSQMYEDYRRAVNKFGKNQGLENFVSSYIKEVDVLFADFITRITEDVDVLEADMFLLYRKGLLNFSKHETWLTLLRFMSSRSHLSVIIKPLQLRLSRISKINKLLFERALTNSAQLGALTQRETYLKRALVKVQKISVPSTPDWKALQRLLKKFGIKIGDITLDSTVNESDKTRLENISKDKTITLTYAEQILGDMNLDGKVEAFDLTLLEEALKHNLKKSRSY